MDLRLRDHLAKAFAVSHCGGWGGGEGRGGGMAELMKSVRTCCYHKPCGIRTRICTYVHFDTEPKITGGHRPFSMHFFSKMTD